MSKETIICAAVKLPSQNKVYYGHRHNHCIEAMNGELSWTLNRQEIAALEKVQGFVTSEGRFVDRKEGARLWMLSGGVLNNPPLLYSEDLY